MKFRTSLLALCMVVVPMLAMFSHLIPAGARRSMRDCVMTWWNAAPRDRSPDDVSSSGGTHPRALSAPVAQPVSQLPGTARSLGGQETLVNADPPPLNDSLRRLSHLGAVAIECVPLPGVAGRHLASCQVPLDPEGQLHRVFQIEGTDADAAVHLLLSDVEDWKRRLAERAAAVGPPRPMGGPSAERF